MIKAIYTEESIANEIVALQDKSAPSNKRKKFMKKRRVPKTPAVITCHFGRANGPMIFLSATNFISGTSAKGSWTDCRMLRVESILVNVSGLKNVRLIAGTIAIERVRRTLCHIGSLKSRKPSMTNWPA